MKKEIRNYLEAVLENIIKDRDIETTYYHNLNNGYSVVLSWEYGFDTEDKYDLCVSLRESNSSYFVDDWKIIGEDSSIEIGECEIIANYLFRLYEEDMKNHIEEEEEEEEE